MEYEYDDGGRKEAGYKGETSDCVVRAIAITTQIPYQTVYNAINSLAETERPIKGQRTKSHARTGVYRDTLDRYMLSLGWTWIPTMFIGSGCKVHLKTSELPTGRILAKVSRHAVAVIDGILHDISDSSRNGTRCVYGYWKKGGE